MVNTDIVMDSFVNVNLAQLCLVPIIAVYKNPSDYPDKYVARLWDIHKRPTKYIMIKNSIEDIRMNIPKTLRRLEPYPQDDPVILETWL